MTGTTSAMRIDISSGISPEDHLISQIGHYFNISITDANKRRLKKYIEEYQKEIRFQQSIPRERVVYQDRKIYIAANGEDLHGPKKTLAEHADSVCADFKITLAQLKTNSEWEDYYPLKRQSSLYSKARRTLILLAIGDGHTRASVQNLIGYSDTTSIIHHLNPDIKAKRHKQSKLKKLNQAS
jgi:hypothetical protein